MIEAHPEESELVQWAFADAGDGDEVPRHVAECVECRGVVEMLRRQANTMRAVAVRTIDVGPGCLDDETIAAFGEGNIPPADSAGSLAHLVACARCREEVASVARALDASDVKSEIERLTQHPKAGGAIWCESSCLRVRSRRGCSSSSCLSRHDLLKTTLPRGECYRSRGASTRRADWCHDRLGRVPMDIGAPRRSLSDHHLRS